MTPSEAQSNVKSDVVKRFEAAMDDDFNSPEALAVLQGLARDLNVAKAQPESSRAAQLAFELRKLGAVLGIGQLQPESFLRKAKTSLENPESSDGSVISDTEIDRLIAAERMPALPRTGANPTGFATNSPPEVWSSRTDRKGPLGEGDRKSRIRGATLGDALFPSPTIP